MKAPTATYRGFKVPGGWDLDVPQIEVRRDDPRFRRLTRRLMRLGAKPLDADQMAAAAIGRFFAARWKEQVLKSVARWGKLYAEQNFGSLDGFRPEMIADAWVPGARFFGRRGDPEVDAMFVEMRRNHERPDDGADS